MAARITSGNFLNQNGETFRVEIHDSGTFPLSLTVETADDGFTLSYQGATDKVVPGIIGSSASVDIKVNEDNRSDIDDFIQDLITSVETRFNLVIWRVVAGVDNLHWVGIVTPDISEYEDIGSAFFLSLRAVDGLGRLKNEEYKDTNFTPNVPYGFLSFITHISQCLTYIGTESFWGPSDAWLRTIVNWSDENMPAVDETKDPLLYSRVSGEIFAERDEGNDGDDYKWKSPYYVLEQICAHWAARLMLSDGAWRFEQIRERHEQNVKERWYDNGGGFLSGTTKTYDTSIDQQVTRFRLRGGAFSWLPALKKVEVDYDHNTYRNYLSSLSNKWYKFSGANSPVSFTNIGFDADSRFRVSGVLNIDVEVDTYDTPWRYVFGVELILTTGDYRIESLTSAVIANGIPVYGDLNRTGPTWKSGPQETYYEVSTPWIFSNRFVGSVPFEFWTPILTASQNAFSIDFTNALGDEDASGNPLTGTVTLNDWSWKSLALAIYGSSATENFEKKRTYIATNATGNSDALEMTEIFGHAVQPWTPGKIQTCDDLATWVDTTATWDRAAATDDFEFGDLLCNELAKLQEIPAQTYAGTLHGAIIKAHDRILLPDLTGWLMSRGDFNARKGEWSGEWIYAGVSNGNFIVTTTPKKIPGPDIFNPGTWEISVGDPDGTGFSNRKISPSTGVSIQAFNTTTTTLSSGAITTIDISEPLKANTIFDGDTIYLYNPQNGQVYPFTVDNDQAGGATSITVDSVDHGIDIPIGSQVLYSLYNFYTGTGGAQGIPPGTAEGQILKWDEVATQWAAYSATTPGNYLTWDATNGWVESAGPSGTVPNGTTSGEILRWNGSAWAVYSGTVDGNVLTWDSVNGWQEESPASGAGDILDGGNTTGAAVTIGTNDAFGLNLETNNVTRVAITGAASTGGAVTITNTTATTNAAQDILTLQTNSTGSPSAGFGGAILFQGESSSTDGQDMARISATWSTVTHASRTSDIVFLNVNNGGALSEHARIVGGATPKIKIGGGTTTYANAAITAGTDFTIGNGSNAVTINSFAANINLDPNSTTTSVNISSGYSSTMNSGTKNWLNVAGGFSPTSGTAVINFLNFGGTINQTGGANGITRGAYINHTITAAADYRALEIAVDHANAKGIYQTGTTTKNNILGQTAFGTTSAPDASAIIDIVSTARGLGLPAMTTAQVNAIGSPRDGLIVYDTDTDTVKARANGAWVSLGTGSGVTGSGSAGQVAYWNGASSITGENALWYDATNDRLGINQSSPAYRLSIKTTTNLDGIKIESDGTLDQVPGSILLTGTATGPLTQTIRIENEVYSAGNALKISIADGYGSSSHYLYRNAAKYDNSGLFKIWNINGGVEIDGYNSFTSIVKNVIISGANSPTADANSRLKIISLGTTSSNWGLRIYDGAGTPAIIMAVRDDKRVGLLTTTPAVTLDAATATDSIALPEGTVAQRPAVNNSIRSNSDADGLEYRYGGAWHRITCQVAPTIAAGAAAGTGPTVSVDLGNDLSHQITVTTGTGPTTGTLCTVTFGSALDAGLFTGVTFSPANANAAGEVAKWYVGSAGNTSYTIACATAPTASTTYTFHIHIKQ
jgi:hypothetical protein